jgi:hypothetical protein
VAVAKKPKAPDGVLYACKQCDKTYSTAAEAKACRKLIADHFKAGDIIQYHGRVWKLKHLPDDTGFSHIERVPDYLHAFGWPTTKEYQGGPWAPAGRYFCPSNNWDMKKLDVNEVVKMLARRRRQVAAGERLLAYLRGRE